MVSSLVVFLRGLLGLSSRIIRESSSENKQGQYLTPIKCSAQQENSFSSFWVNVGIQTFLLLHSLCETRDVEIQRLLHLKSVSFFLGMKFNLHVYINILNIQDNIKDELVTDNFL